MSLDDPAPGAVAPLVLDMRRLRTVFGGRDGAVHAVNDVSFALKAGGRLGVVGESGSGKSVTMMSPLRLIPSGNKRLHSSLGYLSPSQFEDHNARQQVKNAA